jgi:hypothetical protein
MIAVLTEMVASLNETELTLEEMAAVRAGIEQMGSRMTQAVSALQPEPAPAKRPSFRVIQGGQSRPPCIYVLEITLQNSHPRVWRTIEVSGDIDLAELHTIITVLFARRGQLSHAFLHGDSLFGDLEHHGSLVLNIESEAGVILADLLTEPDQLLYYDYHIVNCQRHEIRLLQIKETDRVVIPTCIKGAGQAPPEAKSEFPARPRRKASAKPKPAMKFDLERINKKLKKL